MSGPPVAGTATARHRHRRRGGLDADRDGGGAGRADARGFAATGDARNLGKGRVTLDNGDTRGTWGTGGTEGNERLTAMTGATLLVLFAAEGFTILSLHRLLTMHFFVGMLVIGPVLLKISSTCYRFARYYTGAVPYVRKGPPAPLLRLLGPVVVLTSVGVLGTGVMLAVAGPGPGPWLLLHKALFVLWFGAMTIHVLAYLPRLARLAAGTVRGRDAAAGPGLARPAVSGPAARWLLLASSLGAGLILATLTLHLAVPWRG
jgi:hypothetical protein